MNISCCCDECCIFMLAIILFITSMLSSTLAFDSSICLSELLLIKWSLLLPSHVCQLLYQCLGMCFIRCCFFYCCISHYVDDVNVPPDVRYCCCGVPEKVFELSYACLSGSSSTLMFFLPPLTPRVVPGCPLHMACVCVLKHFRVPMPMSGVVLSDTVGSTLP